MSAPGWDQRDYELWSAIQALPSYRRIHMDQDYALDESWKNARTCVVNQSTGMWYQQPEPEECDLPRISDSYLGCVLYVYASVADANKGEGSGGCGFLATCRLSPESDYGQIYAVTNRHVIKDLRTKVIALRVNTKTATEVIQTKAADWVCSPDDDLAVLPLDLSMMSACKGVVIPAEQFITLEKEIYPYDIGPGDETFSVGRFVTHEGRQRNTPIVRFGNISMMPYEPVRTPDGDQLAFLVECRSIAGFSGAPVFTSIPAGSRRPTHPTPLLDSFGPWLLGINCGHMMIRDGKKTESSAIEVVIPAWRLKTFLGCERLENLRLAEEQEIKAQKKRGFLVRDPLLRRVAFEKSQ